MSALPTTAGTMTPFNLTGRRVSLGDVAYQSLRDAITSLQLAPGEAATEVALAEQLGISRPVVREALQRLQAERLVERQGNGRLRVTGVSPEDVRQLYAARCALDQLAVTDAVNYASDDDVARLQGMLEQMRQYVLAPDGEGIVESGAALYRVLYDIAGNTVNRDLRDNISSRIRRYQHVSVRSTPGRAAQSYEEHEKIVQAVAARDEKAARSAVRSHLDKLKVVVIESLHRQSENPADHLRAP